MQTRTQIDPIPPSTPSEQRASRGPRHDLPPDLLREASNRLSLMALVGGLLWLAGSILAHLTERTITHEHVRGGGGIDYLVVPDVIVAGVVALSIGLFFYARRSRALRAHQQAGVRGQYSPANAGQARVRRAHSGLAA